MFDGACYPPSKTRLYTPLRYVSTAKPEEQIDLHSVYGELADVEKAIREANTKHNGFLEELGLPLLR